MHNKLKVVIVVLILYILHYLLKKTLILSALSTEESTLHFALSTEDSIDNVYIMLSTKNVIDIILLYILKISFIYILCYLQKMALILYKLHYLLKIALTLHFFCRLIQGPTSELFRFKPYPQQQTAIPILLENYCIWHKPSRSYECPLRAHELELCRYRAYGWCLWRTGNGGIKR